MTFNEIEVKIFDFDEKENKISITKGFDAIQINLPINNPIILLGEISKNDIKKYLGKCEYRFRKGVGYKGEFYRLKLKEIKDNKVIFYKFKKENKRLKVDKNNLLILDSKELKYIYPLVLSPEITDQGLQWSKNYIIFPYKYGKKQPVLEEEFKKEAPNLFNYLSSHKSEIMEQSKYNKRIQNVKEFYGVIRVGYYSYSKHFIAIRDNTKFTSCIVSWIETEWEEKKNPIFDNHVSYVSLDTKREAEYLLKKLREPKLKKLVSVLFDNRSIGSRLPFKIPKYKVKK
ncbi:hypothetical protein DRN69_08105 [Candidatus Pacearchaeota archaeon]|nr:MAG: hypothetical protein DRN69_08105 [Candidatus Pacearchaeota archaeon]